MNTKQPLIEDLDDSHVTLTPTMVIPGWFRATFAGDPQVAIEVYADHNALKVLKVTVESEEAGLDARMLRLPLHSKLLPAAVAAAAIAVPPPVPGTLRRGVLGPPGVPTKAARAALQSRPGRPRQNTPHDALVKIAKDYLDSGRRIGYVAGVNFISKATAYRRLEEARQAGLLPPKET